MSSKKRILKPIFILCCSKTEKIYVNLYIKKNCLDYITIVLSEKDPEKMVQKVIYERGSDLKNSHCWVIFDRDEYSNSLQKALILAKKENINVTFNSICFEQWCISPY